MTPRLRRLAGNLALSLVSIIIVLGGLEVASRLALRNRGGGKEDNAVETYTEYETILGWRKRPGARVTYRRREYTVDVVINREGQRDPERSGDSGPSRFRILALGDSFVEGFTVSLEQTVTQLLEKGLCRPDCPVDVINGGTYGYSTDQEYLYYLSVSARSAPEVVTLFFYYNDILFNDLDNYWGWRKPLLPYGRGSVLLPSAPVPVQAPRPPRQIGVERAARSVLFSWVEDRLERGAPRIYESLARLGFWPPIPRSEPREELRVFKKGPTPRMNAAWLRTRLILEALAREVARREARLLVVYVPARFEVDDRAWELTQFNFGMDDEHWDRGLVRRRLKETARRIGLPVLDLTEPLREKTGLLSSPYFTYDNHWNAIGHRIAAEQIRAFLKREQWLPPCAGGR